MEWVVNTRPRPLYPGERPGTHCIGGWVGLREDDKRGRQNLVLKLAKINFFWLFLGTFPSRKKYFVNICLNFQLLLCWSCVSYTKYASFQNLKAALAKIHIVWYMRPCWLTNRHRQICYENGDGNLFRNVCNYLPFDTAQHLRRMKY
jgi:hypothetical protein